MALMRWAILALTFFLIQATAASATKVVTVSQLEAMLTEAHAQHQSDLEITQQLSSVELSERLIDLNLTRLEALLEPGSQAATALELLADQSIFFEPSAAELTDTSMPDTKGLEQIVKATANYVNQYLSASPNLLATRTTVSYSGGGYRNKKDEWIAHPGLNKIRSASQEISIRNDRVEVSQKDKKHRNRGKDHNEEMSSWGEFGALFAVVLNDSAHGGRIFWSYWEPSAAGQLAVLGFQVPQAASHYSFDQMHEVSRPAYHGLLWVEPVSGVVSSLLIQLEPFSFFTYDRFATMVRYGPVKIEDKTCICPVRSAAVEKTDALASDAQDGMWLNEVTFTNYHRFGSTAQIVPNSDPATSKMPASKQPH